MGQCISIVPNTENLPLFLAFKVRNFPWVAVLLFLVVFASYFPHCWYDLSHCSMITAVVTVPEAGWKVRIRRKHDLKEEEEEEEEEKKTLHLAKSSS